MNTHITICITLDELKTLIKGAVMEAIDYAEKPVKESKEDATSRVEMEFVTKEQVKKHFRWSESTFRRREAEGLVQPYKLGNSRPYYDLNEIASRFTPVVKEK